MEWQQQFEIINKIIAERLAQTGRKFTLANAADLLGVKLTKLQAWSKGQRPSADDLENLTRVLGLSADWVLLGNGLPTHNESSGRLVPEYVEIGDTLNELVYQLPDGISEIARTGGMGVHELTECVNSRALPSCLTISKWVQAYRINANFLLAQIGAPFLSEAEYKQSGPLDWHRERRGDFDDQGTAKPATDPSAEDPVVARAEKIAALMSRHGADDEDIREAIMASMKALTPQANEPRRIYGIHEPEKPYDPK